MKNSEPIHKKQPEKSYSIRYSKDLESMLLEIQDIEGMLPLYISVPKIQSVRMRKIVITQNGLLHMI